MKNISIILLIAVFGLLAFARNSVHSAAPSPYDLIAAVNDLRESLGFQPLETDGSLMAAAQGQADYLASISPNVGDGHAGPGGTRAVDRASAAGYPLGPGWNVVENWAAGSTSTPLSDIIYNFWGDPLHWSTMTHQDAVHVGAGISEANGLIYYILDVGVKYGSGGSSGGGVASTIPTTAATAQVSPVKVATPNEDGSIIHEVELGQALWSIAAAYEVTVEELRAMNNLPENAVIYVSQKLLIQVAHTPTPSPTATLTPRPPTRTPIPQQSAQAISTPEDSKNGDENSFLGMDRSTAGLVLILVSGVGLALMVISILSRDKSPAKKDKNDTAV